MKRSATIARPPLQERPLRYPGQSIDEQIVRQQDKVMDRAFVVIVCAIFALWAWIGTISKTPLNPWIPTAVALGGAAWLIRYIWKEKKRLDQMKLGRDGEKIVAETLDVLKQSGATILHDIVNERFNLDHVVLSRHGIFVVETKTRSKPVRGNAIVDYDGTTVLINGWPPDRDPVQQATAQAQWLQETLLATTGKRYPVRPVVVFPGWFVTPLPKGSHIWVLNPKTLPAFIENEPLIVSEEDLRLATSHLTRYIRTVSQP